MGEATTSPLMVAPVLTGEPLEAPEPLVMIAMLGAADGPKACTVPLPPEVVQLRFAFVEQKESVKSLVCVEVGLTSAAVLLPLAVIPVFVWL